MFFMLGTWPGRKELGVIDGYKVYMIYESLLIFFIPVFKFGRRYFAERDGLIFEIDPETGKAIERGGEVRLHFTEEDAVGRNAAGEWSPGARAAWAYDNSAAAGACGTAGSAASEAFGDPDAEMLSAGPDNRDGGAGAKPAKVCMRCGYRTDIPEYSHCPMCGNLLVPE